MSNSNVDSTLLGSWSDWFSAKKSVAILNKNYKKMMFEKFNATITEEKCKDQLLKQDEIAYLFKLNFGQGRVNIIHHFQEIGGNFWSEANESLGAIQGIQKDGTCVVTPDIDQLFGISEGNNTVPKVSDILEIRGTNKIDQLQVSADTRYQARNVIPIPPFMLKKISATIQRSKGDSKEVLLTAVKAIIEFDTEINTNGDDTEKASESCGDLLHLLFLVVKNKIYSTPIIVCFDVQVQTHFKNLEKLHLNQNQPNTTNNNTHTPT